MALGRLALSADWLLSGCVGMGGGKTPFRGAHGIGGLRSTCLRLFNQGLLVAVHGPLASRCPLKESSRCRCGVRLLVTGIHSFRG